MRRGRPAPLLLALAVLFAGGCLRARPMPERVHQRAVDLYHQGVALEDQARWREAIPLFEQSLAVDETPAAHCSLGHCHLELGNLDSAEGHLQRALEMSPSYELAQTYLLQVQSRQGGAEIASAPARPEGRPQVPPEEAAAPAPAPETQPPPPMTLEQAAHVEEISANELAALASPAATPEAAPEAPPPPQPVPVAEAPPPTTPPSAPESASPEAPPPSQAVVTAGAQPALPTVDEIRTLLFPNLHGQAPEVSGAERLRRTRLESPEFHMAQAQSFERDQDLVSALREYRLAFDLDPARIDALLATARLHAQMGHADEAARAYEHASQEAPNNPEVPLQTGNFFLRRGEAERAVGYYERALGLNPHMANAENNLGAALRELGRLDEAITHLRRAEAIDPGYAPPLRNLGNIYADQGKDREALEAYRRYIELGGSESDEVSRWIREIEQRIGQ
jgi:tetratricopeptide (TPR) repeat protein